jgi:hypothetical protein
MMGASAAPTQAQMITENRKLSLSAATYALERRSIRS